MKGKHIAVLFVLILIACLSMSGDNADCFAFERSLRTEEANPEEMKGSFTLILYGGSYLDDLETIALLDSEGDQYVLEPFAPDFKFIRLGSPPLNF